MGTVATSSNPTACVKVRKTRKTRGTLIAEQDGVWSLGTVCLKIHFWCQKQKSQEVSVIKVMLHLHIMGFSILTGVFNPNSEDPLPGQLKKQLVLRIISGQQLPKPRDSMLGDRGEVWGSCGWCFVVQNVYFHTGWAKHEEFTPCSYLSGDTDHE